MNTHLEKLSLSDGKDELQRKNFSKNIALKIASYNIDEPITIGILGKWGSGKSTTLKMIESFIDQEDMIIMHFNPYIYAERENLCADFFKLLAQTIHDYEGHETFAPLTESLIQYSNTLLPISYIQNFDDKKSKLSSNDEPIDDFFHINDIRLLKNSISQSFKALDKKVLVIIDDIDHLNEYEIQKLFKLIHALANFNNLIYLTAMDKKNIELAFGNGEGYFNQVIQVPIYLSEIGQTKINQLFYKKIEEWLSSFSNYNEAYWKTMYKTVFVNGFSDIRSVERYLNTIKFEYNFNGQNLNVIDYLVITYFKIFEQKIYLYIKNHKEDMLARSVSTYTGKFRETLPLLFPVKDDDLKNRIYDENVFDRYFLD